MMFVSQSSSLLHLRQTPRPRPGWFHLVMVTLLLLNWWGSPTQAQPQTRPGTLPAAFDIGKSAAPRLPYVLAQHANADSETNVEAPASLTSATAAHAAPLQLANSLLPARWQQLSGPEAGPVPALTQKDGRVYAGTFGGLYVSADRGQTWARLVTTPALQTSNTIVQLGDTLIYGTDANGIAQEVQGGIWRSRDQGQTWERANSGLPARSWVSHLAVWQGVLVATVYGGGSGVTVYRSADGGDAWEKAGDGLPEDLYFFFPASNNRTLLAGSSAGIFRSLDGGLTWQDISANLPEGMEASANIYLQNDGKGWLLVAGKHGLLRSTDDGTTWQPLNNGLPAGVAIGDLSLGGSDLFVSLENGALYRSTDGGQNWELRNSEFAFGKTVRSWLKVGDTTLVGTGDGIYRSEDDGATWERSNTGMRNTYNDGGFITVGRRMYVSTSGGVWVSDNKGASWRLMIDGWRQEAFSSIAGGGIGEKDGVIFANSYYDGMYRSANGGNTWERLSNGLPERVCTLLVKVFNEKLYINDIAKGEMYVSSDDGNTWEKIADFKPGTVYTMASLGGHSLLLGAYGKGVFRSDDDGVTWREFNAGLENKFVDDFNVYRDVVLVGTDDGIFRLTEESWTKLPHFSEAIQGGITYLARVGKTLFASSLGRGISVSYDNGNSWSSYNAGLTTERGFYLQVMEGDLYFGSAGAGMWVLRKPPAAPVEPF